MSIIENNTEVTVTISIYNKKTNKTIELYGAVENLSFSSSNQYDTIYSIWNADNVAVVPISKTSSFTMTGVCLDELPKQKAMRINASKTRWSDITEDL